MLTFQGWFIVQAHWLEEEEDNYNMVDAGISIRRKASILAKYGNIFIAVTNLNGTDTISIASSSNRKREEHQEVLDFVKYVAKTAPGSYGILHYFDDGEINNDMNDTYQCYILRKGKIFHEIDERFSPYSLKVAE